MNHLGSRVDLELGALVINPPTAAVPAGDGRVRDMNIRKSTEAEASKRFQRKNLAFSARYTYISDLQYNFLKCLCEAQ